MAIAGRYDLPDPPERGRKRVENGIRAAAERLGLEH